MLCSSTQGKREDPLSTGTSTTAGASTTAGSSTTGGPSTSAGPSTTVGQNTTAGPCSTGGSSTTARPSSAAGQGTSVGTSSLGQGTQTQGTTEEKKDPEAEGLAQLIPDIQETAKLMQKVVQEFREEKASCSKLVERAGKGPVEETASLSAEERYLASMKPLQFGEC